MSEEQRFVTVAQAAKMIQVHPETVREWLRAGKLPGTLVSRRAGWRIRASDIERLLAGELPEWKTTDRDSNPLIRGES